MPSSISFLPLVSGPMKEHGDSVRLGQNMSSHSLHSWQPVCVSARLHSAPAPTSFSLKHWLSLEDRVPFSHRASEYWGFLISGKVNALNPMYLIHRSHRPHCGGGIQKWRLWMSFSPTPFIRTEPLGSRKRNLYNYTETFHLPWVRVNFLY